MSVFSDLVGQAPAIETLQQAARGHGMSHAWLVTGPPGSGRSNAALAFAAALQCEQAGCGECEACRTTLAGSHPDVLVQSTERMIISVDLAREWVLRAALKPVRDWTSWLLWAVLALGALVVAGFALSLLRNRPAA